MKTKNILHTYLMPGMSANSLIFEKIKLNGNFKLHYLEWIDPKKNESLKDYSIRFSKKINHKNPILIGVSFGGILVQEISKIIDVRKIIIISSVKSNQEFPPTMKIVKATKSYKFLPVKWINDFDSLLSFVLGPKVKKKIELYHKYLSVRDENYLSWAIKALIEWDQADPIDNVLHIHGTKDMIFPSMYLENYVPLPKGDHAMILKRAEWINEFLNKNIF